MDFITTGIPSLDMLLGGGVRTGATTEFFGERGVGKSKIVHQLCVNVQLPPSRGGLEGKAIFIDTEGSFRREWVAKIASALGLRPAKALRNILVKRVFTTEEQMSALEEAEIEREGVKLVVVDALNSLFKKEYFPGKWVERHQKLARHLHTLNKLADMKDLAVVVTNHVVEPRGESGVGYAVRTRVRILKGEGEVRIARLVDDPMLEEMERPFYLPG
jgi:DNA repair protein RadA